MKIRARSLTKWAAVLLCLIVLALWSISGSRELGPSLLTAEWSISIKHGELSLVDWETTDDDKFRIQAKDPLTYAAPVATPPAPNWWTRAQWTWSNPRWKYFSGIRQTYFRFTLPLWLVFAILLALTITLFFLDRRSVRWGEARRCRRCG